MKLYYCNKKCCTLKVEPYNGKKIYYKKKRKKAGVFIYNIETGKILIIQSKGDLWGIPKGSIEEGENTKDCAIREVLEETGLKIKDNFTDKVVLYNSSTYYYLELKEELSIKPQTHIKNNDANGIGWISLDCLQKMIKSKRIEVNRHFKLVVKKFRNIDL